MKDQSKPATPPESTGAPQQPAPAPAPRQPPNLLLVVMGILLAAGAALGLRELLHAGTERTDDASIFADIIPLSARASSQVARVLVREDQPVKQGEVLLELDDRVASLQEAQAETELGIARAQARSAAAEVQVVKAQAFGGLRSAQAALVATREQSSQMLSRIAAAEADVQRAEKEMQRASSELARVEKLFASEMVSQSNLDDARVGQEVARTALARAQAELLSAHSQKQLSESRVVEAQGHLDQSSASEARVHMAEAAAELATTRVAAAERALEMARLQRSFLKVIAPRDGTIAKLMVREGQFVQTGQTLVQLVPSPTIVVANFKETQIQKIRPGQRATLYVDAYPDQPLSGEVVSVAGGTGASFSLLPPNNASGNFVKVVQRVPVRISLKEPAKLPLQAGLSVEAVIEIR
ncbi:MAG: HlyD family secretion protein [Myxococcaceae bacterium]|nr:HlyD family secretion protein [Myxococcaceae bacterium]